MPNGDGQFMITYEELNAVVLRRESFEWDGNRCNALGDLHCPYKIRELYLCWLKKLSHSPTMNQNCVPSYGEWSEADGSCSLQRRLAESYKYLST